MMLESTFCLIMLNLWEKLLVSKSDLASRSSPLIPPTKLPPLAIVSIVGLFFVLIYISIVNYLPSYLRFLRNRIAYYVFGDESVPLFNDVWSWISRAGTRAEGSRYGSNTTLGLVLGTGTNVVSKAVEVVVTGRSEL
jgi:hypothetical protein